MERLIFCVGIIAAILGCRKEEIHVYRVAKQNTAVTPFLSPAATTASAAVDSPGVPMGGEIQWKVPAGWKTQPASGMRFASFSVPGKGPDADMSVVTFPGPAGGMLANINRWRGQVSLDPWDESALKSQSQRVMSKAGELVVVDFSGSDGKSPSPKKVRMLGAVLSAGEKTWFFKLTGDDAVVSPAKPAFIQFIKSLKNG